MNELEKRIESLELCNRRWWRAAWITATVVLAGLMVAAKTPEGADNVLRAKRIEVLAPDGTPAIVLSADDHNASLTISAPAEESDHAIALNAGKDGTQLMMMRGKESPLFLVLTDEAGSTLALSANHELKERSRSISLRSIRRTDRYGGGAYIMLARNGGHKRADIDAMFSVREPDGKVAIVLGDFNAGDIALKSEDGVLEFVEPDRVSN